MQGATGWVPCKPDGLSWLSWTRWTKTETSVFKNQKMQWKYTLNIFVVELKLCDLSNFLQPGEIWYQAALFSENSFIKDFWSFVWGSSITKSFLFLQDHLNISLSEWQTECKLLQCKLLKILEQFCVRPLLNLYWSPVRQKEKFFNQLHQTKVWIFWEKREWCQRSQQRKIGCKR